MNTQDYRIIHQEYEGNTLIEVIDEGEFRSLFFAKKFLQSRIHRLKPQQLILPYSQHMLMCLPLLDKDPRHILLIGIGGAALIHFLQYHFPDCKIDAVDNSARIIELAMRYFFLKENKLLTIYHQDGGMFIEKQAPHRHYDLILVDAFTGHGMAPSVYSRSFFARARSVLSASNYLCCNLWSSSGSQWHQLVDDMKSNFPGYVLVPVPKRGNIISIASESGLSWQDLAQKTPNLRSYRKRLGLDFPAMYSSLQQHNHTLFQRLASLLVSGLATMTQSPDSNTTC